MTHTKQALIGIALFCLAFFLRFSTQHVPFWVDEFSTAQQAKVILDYGLKTFSQDAYYFESNNLLTHLVTAGSFILFGVGEWQARVPMMLIGSLVPVAFFFLSRKYFGNATAIVSTMLYTFSYWQITWARQARGYVLQQLFVILLLWVYQELLKGYSKSKVAIFVTLSVLGVLTHTTFMLVLFALGIHFVIIKWKELKTLVLRFKYLALIPFGLFGVLLFTGQAAAIITNLQIILSDPANNVAYYHSFLWREQTIITFLAFIGVLVLFWKRRDLSQGLLLTLPILMYLFFVSFLFHPYVSRYLLPIFPLFILLAGVGIAGMAKFISKKYSLIFSLGLVFFIIFNGDKFSYKPRDFYSPNNDMREVAIIDYDQVYDLIQSRVDLSEGQTAVIETWPDRQKWYLGKPAEYFYIFRWGKNEGTTNGLARETPYQVNVSDEKFIPGSGNPSIRLIAELSDLEKTMIKYKQGFIFIDDSSLPADVREYVEKNMKQELYLDRYALEENPYSLWPATLYSWGFETPNPYYQEASASTQRE